MLGLRFARRRFGLPPLHINDSARRQTVTGFGEAMTVSSAWLLHNELRLARSARLRWNFSRPSSGAA